MTKRVDASISLFGASRVPTVYVCNLAILSTKAKKKIDPNSVNMTDVEIRLATILSAREEQFDAFKRQGDIGQNFMPTELSPCFSDADDSNNITNITNIMEIETNSLENNILDQNCKCLFILLL